MSRGKCSIEGFKKWPEGYEFRFNCYGDEPVEWTREMAAAGDPSYNAKTMFGCFDEEGYDYYGYSCFDENGEFVGNGKGIDRAGYTEDDYMNNRDLPAEGYQYE